MAILRRWFRSRGEQGRAVRFSKARRGQRSRPIKPATGTSADGAGEGAGASARDACDPAPARSDVVNCAGRNAEPQRSMPRRISGRDSAWPAARRFPCPEQAQAQDGLSSAEGEAPIEPKSRASRQLLPQLPRRASRVGQRPDLSPVVIERALDREILRTLLGRSAQPLAVRGIRQRLNSGCHGSHIVLPD